MESWDDPVTPRRVSGRWEQVVPLSEEEQRILTEIEHQLRASDPDLARQVSETTVFSAPIRHTKLAVAGLVAGLAATLALLLVANAYAAFVVGFGIMFVCAISLERSVRRIGRMSLEQLGAALSSPERTAANDTESGNDA